MASPKPAPEPALEQAPESAPEPAPELALDPSEQLIQTEIIRTLGDNSHIETTYVKFLISCMNGVQTRMQTKKSTKACRLWQLQYCIFTILYNQKPELIQDSSYLHNLCNTYRSIFCNKESPLYNFITQNILPRTNIIRYNDIEGAAYFKKYIETNLNTYLCIYGINKEGNNIARNGINHYFTIVNNGNDYYITSSYGSYFVSMPYSITKIDKISDFYDFCKCLHKFDEVDEVDKVDKEKTFCKKLVQKFMLKYFLNNPVKKRFDDNDIDVNKKLFSLWIDEDTANEEEIKKLWNNKEKYFDVAIITNYEALVKHTLNQNINDEMIKHMEAAEAAAAEKVAAKGEAAGAAAAPAAEDEPLPSVPEGGEEEKAAAEKAAEKAATEKAAAAEEEPQQQQQQADASTAHAANAQADDVNSDQCIPTELHIFDVNPDGNCLFFALFYGLIRLNITKFVEMDINIESTKNDETFVQTIKTFRIQIVKWIFKNLYYPAGASVAETFGQLNEEVTFGQLILRERKALYQDYNAQQERNGGTTIEIPSNDIILKTYFEDMIRVTGGDGWFWGDATIITAFRQMTKINVVVIEPEVVVIEQEVVVIQKQKIVVNYIREGNICFDGIWLCRVNKNHYKIIFPYNVNPDYRDIKEQFTRDIKSFNISEQIYENYQYKTYQKIASITKLANQMQNASESNNAVSVIYAEGWESKIDNFENMIVDTSKKWTDIEPEIDKLIKTEGGRNINMHFNNKKPNKPKKPKKTKKRVLLNKKTKKRLFLNKKTKKRVLLNKTKQRLIK
jgi:hypothetical protein